MRNTKKKLANLPLTCHYRGMKRTKNDPRYEIDFSRSVFVYKNLHKDCWSVKQDGLVKAHTTELDLWDCHFQVNAEGRKRVLREKRKNVHAGIKGYIDCLGQGDLSLIEQEVTYNPYKYDSFVKKETEEPVFHSMYAKLYPKKVLTTTS